MAKAQNIVLSTHEYPDADGIGSQIALCQALRELGKNAICVNEEPLLERYKYLDPFDVVISLKEYNEKYLPEQEKKFVDLFIIADTNNIKRIGFKMEKLALQAKELLFIDHHPAPKAIMALHYIDTKASATSELVGTLIEDLGIPFTQELALPLYTGVLIDTSSFRYPTVTSSTHKLISKLLKTGIAPPQAYNYIYGHKQISYVKFLGKILSRSGSNQDGSIAWLQIQDKELKQANMDPEDTYNFINHLLILENIKVACMFLEIDQQIKVSFRSAGTIDVGHIAVSLGGGGHNHSAATLVKGEIDEVIKEMIPKIELILKSE